jgi:DNA-directed RNA polymerase specialized sigma24 family protein
VNEHGKRLFTPACHICGNETLAEDLLQESLLEIHRALLLAAPGQSLPL